jgi:hypothetical protein
MYRSSVKAPPSEEDINESPNLASEPDIALQAADPTLTIPPCNMLVYHLICKQYHLISQGMYEVSIVHAFQES